MRGRMVLTAVLVVVGLVALVGTGLLAAYSLNALGYGPETHEPEDDGPDELTGRG